MTIRTTLVFVMPAPAIRAATDHVTRLLKDNVLTHPIAARHRLESIASAHRDVETGHGIGKVIIEP